QQQDARWLWSRRSREGDRAQRVVGAGVRSSQERECTLVGRSQCSGRYCQHEQVAGKACPRCKRQREVGEEIAVVQSERSSDVEGISIQEHRGAVAGWGGYRGREREA